MQTILSLILSILFLCSFMSGQVNPSDSHTEKEGRIRTLKRELHAIKKPERIGDFERRQVELAQMGEPEQLQQILCEMDFGSPPVVQIDAIDKLRYVGGWLAIRSAARFLSDDPKNKRLNSDRYGMHPSLQVAALMTLPHLVDNPPLDPVRIKPIPTDYSSEVRVWLEWLAKNHDLLSKLQPTGENIVVSASVCRSVLRHDPISIYYNLPVKSEGPAKLE